MKYKNYKSVIHNFANSFQSIDYTRSSILVCNILFDLNNKAFPSNVTFDFINKTITPKEALNEAVEKLLVDYLEWLPELCLSQNCDAGKIEKLIINVNIDYNRIFTPQGMPDFKEIIVNSITNYKIFDKPEQTIAISRDELISNNYLVNGFPVF